MNSTVYHGQGEAISHDELDSYSGAWLYETPLGAWKMSVYILNQ